MFKTPVYHDPYDSNFVEWAVATLVGTWKVKLDVESFMEFSHEEDAIAYEITWYKEHAYSTGREAGAFYCPYVPLTSSGVIMDSESVDSVKTFTTRYGYII